MTNFNDHLVVVKNYERDKIYRLTRRHEALQNLLNTSYNKNSYFVQKIKDSLSDCEIRQKKWWEKIFQRYRLEKYSNKKLRVSIYTGEIFLN